MRNPGAAGYEGLCCGELVLVVARGKAHQYVGINRAHDVS